MRTFTIIALALLASTAATAAVTADDPSPSERVWRLFPSEVEPYRPGTVPLHLTDRDFASRSDWDNDVAPGTTRGSPGDYRGNNVSISLPDGRRNIREAIQGAIQDFGRMMGWGGSDNDGGDTDTSSSSSSESLSGGDCCSGDDLGGTSDK